MDINTDSGCDRATDLDMTLGGGAGSDITCPQVAVQTMGICMAFGGNTGYRHQHRLNCSRAQMVASLQVAASIYLVFGGNTGHGRKHGPQLWWDTDSDMALGGITGLDIIGSSTGHSLQSLPHHHPLSSSASFQLT